MSKLINSGLLVCVILFSGCSLIRTAEQPSGINMPETWNEAADAPANQQVSWWKDFNDPQLDKLIDQALRTNNDFRAAAIRVRRAQLQASQVDTNLTPSLSVGASTGTTRTFDPIVDSRSSSVSASVSYELDLWGKLSSQRDAAQLELDATGADCQAFALSLIGTTARQYWQVVLLKQFVELNAADIASAEKSLALTRTRYEAGAVSELSILQAELSLFNQQAAQTQLVQQLTEARHALAILFDQAPESEVITPTALPNTTLPSIAAGIPAETLANRPDLHAAELRLRGALVNVDITRTSFYPTFTLTGSLGAASTALTSFSQNAVSSLGAALSLPFIQWNTTRLAIKVSKSQYEEAVINFRQRLYVALSEVEDSLSARAQLLKEETKLGLAKTRAQRAEKIAHNRFDEGVTDIQPWLDAQAGLRGSERAVAQNRSNQLNNQVRIYKALGLGATSNEIVCR